MFTVLIDGEKHGAFRTKHAAMEFVETIRSGTVLDKDGKRIKFTSIAIIRL